MELQWQVPRVPSSRAGITELILGSPAATSSHFGTMTATCISAITSSHPNPLCQSATQLNRAGTWRAEQMGR